MDASACSSESDSNTCLRTHSPTQQLAHLHTQGPEFRKRVLDESGNIIMSEFDQIWKDLRVLARSSPTDKYTLVCGLLATEAVWGFFFTVALKLFSRAKVSRRLSPCTGRKPHGHAPTHALIHLSRTRPHIRTFLFCTLRRGPSKLLL